MENQDKFNAALALFVIFAQGVLDDHMRVNGYSWHEAIEVDNPLAPKFVRVVKVHTQTMTHAIIRREDGAILYSAGYGRPFIAKNDKGKPAREQSSATVRGSLYDAATWAKCIGPYGVKTIR